MGVYILGFKITNLTIDNSDFTETCQLTGFPGYIVYNRKANICCPSKNDDNV